MNRNPGLARGWGGVGFLALLAVAQHLPVRQVGRTVTGSGRERLSEQKREGATEKTTEKLEIQTRKKKSQALSEPQG